MASKIRLRGEALPLDLLLVTALALITTAIGMNVHAGQGVIAFALQALLLYALVSAVLPENEPLGSLLQRTTLSIALALVASLAEIALGVREFPLVIAAILVLILAVLAQIRRSAVPRRRRFSLYTYRYGLRSSRKRIPQSIVPAVVLLLMIAAISLGYVNVKNEKHEGSTEFYVTGLGIKSDGRATATVGVINHEGVEANYTIAVEMNGERAAQRDAHLADGDAYEDTLEWRISADAGDLCALRIILYRNEEMLKEYQKTLRISDYITETPRENISAGGETQQVNVTLNATDASKNISQNTSLRSTSPSVVTRRGSARSGGTGSSGISSSSSEGPRDESAASERPQNVSTAPEANTTGTNLSGAAAKPDSLAAVANATLASASIMDALTNASIHGNQTKEGSHGLALSDTSTNASAAPAGPENRSAAPLPPSLSGSLNRSTGASENRSQEVVPPKTPPEIERLEPDKESPQKVGTTVVWTVRASGPADGLSYRFFLNGRPISGWSSSPSWTWYTSGIPAGEYNVSACVRGSNNRDCEDTAWSLYTLLPVNLPPELTALVPDPDGPQPQGTQIRWSASASDAENDTLLYRFYVDGLPAGEWSGSGVFIMNTSGLAPGNHTVRVGVRDGLHSAENDDSLERVVEILAANTPPGITGLAPDRESPQPAGSVITWTASADDPDNDPIQYRFLVDGVAVSDWSANPRFVWNTSGYTEGEHRVSVLARDGHHEDPDRRDVVFYLEKKNSPPRVLSLLPDRNDPLPVGSRITWSALAEDPDNDPIQYRFLVDGVAVSEWSSSAVFELDTSNLSPGNHTLSVYVRDNMHADHDDAKEKGFELVAPNRPPAGLKLSPSPESPQPVGSMIAWTASADDPDNDTLLYRFSLNGKAVTDWSPSGSWMWNTSGLPPGEYMVGVWVRDGRHASSAGFDSAMTSKFILTQENRPPELISLTPDKAGPYEPGDEVVWTAEAVDPEGDPLLYRFFVDGVAASDWSGTGRWTLSVSEEGRHSITASVRDDSHETGQSITSEFTVESRRVENHPPVIESLTPDLSSPQHAGISVIWTARAQDPENDPLLYRFLVDGSPATDWSASGKFTWNTVGVAAGDHNITVQVRDESSISSISQIYTIRSIVDEALSGIGSRGSAALGSKNISSVRVGR
ncbi:MAG: DUF1616 domain-containing protein [Methanothrix sp.]|uniref:DUF1616 domain-containing protein n=2 Tax=Methanothrix sp. TaxID=90426 RepID=UPI0032AF4385|nr:DUF1616 domain-containing protein [Methanothrix sp.]